MDEDRGILDELAADHDHLRVLFSRLAGVPLGDPERKAIVEEATSGLVRHFVAEEVCLYPLLRELPDGPALADRQLAEHAEIEELLRELQRRSAASTGFDRLAAQLVERATGHFGEEEAQVFPVLRAAVAGPELARLGDRARWMKHRAGTHPRHHQGTPPPRDELLPPERGPAARLREFLHPA